MGKQEGVRRVVVELAARGPLPTALNTPQAELEEWVRLLDEAGLEAPAVSEVPLLLGLFPRDDDEAFELAWSVLHMIEACPDWPVREALDACESEWAAILRLRLRNVGETPPTA